MRTARHRSPDASKPLAVILIAAFLIALLISVVLTAPAHATKQVRPAHYNMWICIHKKEGAWNDPNPPYFGGLQMGYWFMQTYGAKLYRTKGTADHWTPLEQMWVAENAYKREGYSLRWMRGQWPVTSYGCV